MKRFTLFCIILFITYNSFSQSTYKSSTQLTKLAALVDTVCMYQRLGAFPFSYERGTADNIRVEEYDGDGNPKVVLADAVIGAVKPIKSWVRILLNHNRPIGVINGINPFTCRTSYKQYLPVWTSYSQDELPEVYRLQESYMFKFLARELLKRYEKFNPQFLSLKDLVPVSGTTSVWRPTTSQSSGTRMGEEGIQQYSTTEASGHYETVDIEGFKNAGKKFVCVYGLKVTRDYGDTQFADVTVVLHPDEASTEFNKDDISYQDFYYSVGHLIDKTKVKNTERVSAVNSESSIVTKKLTGVKLLKMRNLTNGTWIFRSSQKDGHKTPEPLEDETLLFSAGKLKVGGAIDVYYTWSYDANFNKIIINEGSEIIGTFIIYQLNSHNLDLYWTEKKTLTKFTH